MNVSELKEICSATCFKFIDNKLVYPNKKNLRFMIIYPTDGYYLTKEQYMSIFNVIKKRQDNCYCISDIEFEDSFTRQGSVNDLGYTHRIYDKFVYEDYKAQHLLFENALYDINKKWGVTIFQDYFAILSAEYEIMKEIEFNYSNAKDLKCFSRFIKSSQITNRDFKYDLLFLLSNFM